MPGPRFTLHVCTRRSIESFFVDPSNDRLDLRLLDRDVADAVAAGDAGDQVGRGGVGTAEAPPVPRTVGADLPGVGDGQGLVDLRRVLDDD
ncbi:MAG: hypothetical protein ACRDIY_09810 [Chloroflexota bacterium]